MAAHIEDGGDRTKAAAAALLIGVGEAADYCY
jgi:hypothetical protein